MSTLLQVDDLRTEFKTDRGFVKAVGGISYHIDECEIVALVGESGSGKSVSQLSILQLIPMPPGEISGGRVLFEGCDLLGFKADGPEMRSVRGGKISMIFQEPMTSLNPVLTIGRQLTEMLEIHLKLNERTARKRAVELLELVGLSDATIRIDHYPHQFSGGMRQRIMIATALSCNPRLIIADEPTTALDVTTQAQLLELMTDMVARFKTSLVIVTHNLGVVARYANRIYVMYAGRIVEAGTSEEVFGDARHPYTRGLLNCVPRLDQARDKQLVPIWGMPPDLIDMPPHCAFRPRCGHRQQCEFETRPELGKVTGQHFVACHVDIKERQP